MTVVDDPRTRKRDALVGAVLETLHGTSRGFARRAECREQLRVVSVDLEGKLGPDSVTRELAQSAALEAVSSRLGPSIARRREEAVVDTAVLVTLQTVRDILRANLNPEALDGLTP